MGVFDADEDIVLFTDDWTPVDDTTVTTPDGTPDESTEGVENESSDADTLSSFTWEELASQEEERVSFEPGNPASDHEDSDIELFNCQDMTTPPEVISYAVSLAPIELRAPQCDTSLPPNEALPETVSAPAATENPLYQSRYASWTKDAPSAINTPQNLKSQSGYISNNTVPALPTIPLLRGVKTGRDLNFPTDLAQARLANNSSIVKRRQTTASTQTMSTIVSSIHRYEHAATMDGSAL
jgi:hypothetical protein